jgi:hypothetical protein
MLRKQQNNRRTIVPALERTQNEGLKHLTRPRSRVNEKRSSRVTETSPSTETGRAVSFQCITGPRRPVCLLAAVCCAFAKSGCPAQLSSVARYTDAGHRDKAQNCRRSSQNDAIGLRHWAERFAPRACHSWLTRGQHLSRASRRSESHRLD